MKWTGCQRLHSPYLSCESFVLICAKNTSRLWTVNTWTGCDVDLSRSRASSSTVLKFSRCWLNLFWNVANGAISHPSAREHPHTHRRLLRVQKAVWSYMLKACTLHIRRVLTDWNAIWQAGDQLKLLAGLTIPARGAATRETLPHEPRKWRSTFLYWGRWKSFIAWTFAANNCRR